MFYLYHREGPNILDLHCSLKSTASVGRFASFGGDFISE